MSASSSALPAAADASAIASESLSAQIDALSGALRADPYRPDLLIERLLLHCGAARHEAAREDLHVLERLGVARRMLPALGALLTGALRVRCCAGVYLLYASQLDIAHVELTEQCVQDALCEAWRFFGVPGPKLVVELTERLPGLHHAASDVAGIGYIKLSPLRSLREYEAIVAHELAHLHLRSGNRFLDEGIAVFFQARHDRTSIFVGSRIDGETLLRTRGHAIPALRAMLAYDARSDLFFERLVPDAALRPCVYVAAHALVAHALDRLGMDGLRRLCEALQSRAPSAHPSVVAHALGEPIESLDRRLLRASSGRGSSDALPMDELRALTPASVFCTPLSAEEAARQVAGLRAAVTAVSDPAHEPRGLLVRALARRVFVGASASPFADLAELRSLVHDLTSMPGLPERERVCLEVWQSLTEVHSAPSMAACISSWSRALEICRQALAHHADDPEILCAVAALHAQGPVAYGADRACARACMEKARHAPGWSRWVEAFERSLEGVS